MRLKTAIALAAVTLLVPCALAQSVSSVPGAEVSAGEQSWEYRIGFADDADDGARLTQRLHYQRSLSDRLRLRAVVLGSDAETGRFELAHVQGEIHWQLVERTATGYASGVRFEGRLTESDDGADRLGVVWVNQWTRDDAWQVRASLHANQEIGAQGRDGVNLSARARLSHPFGDGFHAGLEAYSGFGNTALGIGSFKTQSHQAGPVVGGRMTGSWGWSAVALFGLSDAATDADLRLRLTRDF